jgi:hypothetical protein
MTDITTATVETTTQPAAPATLDAVRLKYGLTARYILRGEDQPAERPKPDPPPRSPTERRKVAAARSCARSPEDDPS